MKRSRKAALVLSIMATTFLATGYAADDPADKTATAANAAELAKLKAQLEQQQKLIEQLSATLAAQKKELDEFSTTGAVAVAPALAAAPVHALPSIGEVASTTPILPPPAPGPTPRALDPQMPTGDPTSPLQFKIGDATVQPIGFMDFTAIWKSENAGGSLGSSFGSVPFNNVSTNKLSEFRFSPQNSRFGFRIDANVKDAHIIAYNENDFIGTSGTNNLSVTNGAFVPRLRLFWVDIRKGAWEILGGQSWSLLTPGRKGISPLPGDIFYSQATDVNYVVGLTWTRQPGFRFVYHPSEQVAIAVAVENPDAYIGGSSGGPAPVLPSALSSLAGSQLDNATNVQTTPNLHPDIIAKIAFDPSSRIHFEVAGIERTFRVWDSTTNAFAANTYFTKVGGGGSFNGNFEIVKNFHLITNNYWSDGGGRYMFGQAPDLVVRSDGSISPIHSGGVVEGFEATVGKTLLYAYWSGVYIGKNVALDANGTTLIGYGYRGSANSQDRDIQEITFGFNQTIWKDPKWGAVNVMGQYAYVFREPWYVATGAPKAAHDNTIFMNLRYTLPGSAPAMK